METFGQNWDTIASHFSDRSDVQCQQRWAKVVNPDLIKGPWTKEVMFHRSVTVFIAFRKRKIVCFICDFDFLLCRYVRNGHRSDLNFFLRLLRCIYNQLLPTCDDVIGKFLHIFFNTESADKKIHSMYKRANNKLVMDILWRFFPYTFHSTYHSDSVCRKRDDFFFFWLPSKHGIHMFVALNVNGLEGGSSV